MSPSVAAVDQTHQPSRVRFAQQVVAQFEHGDSDGSQFVCARIPQTLDQRLEPDSGEVRLAADEGARFTAHVGHRSADEAQLAFQVSLFIFRPSGRSVLGERLSKPSSNRSVVEQ